MAETRPNLTPARKAWLTELCAGPAKPPAGSRVGYDCLLLQWTEHCYRDKADGKLMDFDQFKARYDDGVEIWDVVDDAGHQITEWGRRALGTHIN